MPITRGNILSFHPPAWLLCANAAKGLPVQHGHTLTLLKLSIYSLAVVDQRLDVPTIARLQSMLIPLPRHSSMPYDWVGSIALRGNGLARYKCVR